MTDEIKLTGSVNVVDIVATLTHVTKEMERLGDVVKEEGTETRRRFEALHTEIAGLDKAQALTDKGLKIFIAKVSGGVSAAVALLLWAVKSGVLAMLL